MSTDETDEAGHRQTCRLRRSLRERVNEDWAAPIVGAAPAGFAYRLYQVTLRKRYVRAAGQQTTQYAQ
jgi:hypothetical protein